jgi:single-strand DNA-binding protein
MSNGVNKVIILGNLGSDPEVRYLESGNAVCTLRVAVGERRKDGDGWKDHTEWMDVVTWGKTAENAGQYLAKGRQVYVEGRLQTREYEDKEGIKRKATEVVAQSLLFLGGRDGGSQAGQDKKTAQKPTQAAQGGGGGFGGDDIPFAREVFGED